MALLSGVRYQPKFTVFENNIITGSHCVLYLLAKFYCGICGFLPAASIFKAMLAQSGNKPTNLVRHCKGFNLDI